MICSNQIDEYYGHYYSIRLFLGPLNVKPQFIIPSICLLYVRVRLTRTYTSRQFY